MHNHDTENTTSPYYTHKENTLGIKSQFNRKTFIEKYVFVYKHFHFLIMNHVCDERRVRTPLKGKTAWRDRQVKLLLFVHIYMLIEVSQHVFLDRVIMSEVR